MQCEHAGREERSFCVTRSCCQRVPEVYILRCKRTTTALHQGHYLLTTTLTIKQPDNNMFSSTILTFLALITASLASVHPPNSLTPSQLILSHNSDPCYISTTTVPHPALSCTPFNGVCPMIICADDARPKATVTVPANYAELVTGCASVPTVTSYGGKCTTDCGPITCPTLTVTKTGEEEKECCTAY